MINPCERISWMPIIENINPIIAGFQLKLSIVNCEKTACNEPFGNHNKKADINNHFKFFIDKIVISCVNGFNLTIGIATIRSF